MDNSISVVPKWYSQSVLHNDDDTIIINWVLDGSGKFHRGYCKFCEVLLWDDNSGDTYYEYSHMITEHPEQVAIFRLGHMGDN